MVVISSYILASFIGAGELVRMMVMILSSWMSSMQTVPIRRLSSLRKLRNSFVSNCA